jgi:hypothetical protein
MKTRSRLREVRRFLQRYTEAHNGATVTVAELIQAFQTGLNTCRNRIRISPLVLAREIRPAMEQIHGICMRHDVLRSGSSKRGFKGVRLVPSITMMAVHKATTALVERYVSPAASGSSYLIISGNRKALEQDVASHAGADTIVGVCLSTATISLSDMESIVQAVEHAATLHPPVVKLPILSRLASHPSCLQVLEAACTAASVTCQWSARPEFTHDQVISYCRIGQITSMEANARTASGVKRKCVDQTARLVASSCKHWQARVAAAATDLRSAHAYLFPSAHWQSDHAAHKALAAELNARGTPTMRSAASSRTGGRATLWTPQTVGAICLRISFNPLQPQPTIIQVHDTIARLQHHQHRTADHQPDGTGGKVHS